ncbi:MAG: protein-disulfide reductase DsbD N-terminal domain-containing protein, partial [Methylohalobius sp.]
MARFLLLVFGLSLILSWPVSGRDPLEALTGSAKTLGLNLFQDELLPADQAFRFSAEVENPTTVRLNWQIASGYYLYRNQFKVEKLGGDVQLGQLQLPPGEQKEDPEFGPTEVYHRSLVATLPVDRAGVE